MAKGKLVLIFRFGGEFVTNDDGTLTYNGGEENEVNVTCDTPFNDLKIHLAETFNLSHETVSVKYFLPENKRTLITAKNDKDVKRMIDFHGETLKAEVFIAETLGFIRKTVDVETDRQTEINNDENFNDDQEPVEFVGPSAVATCDDDDASPETILTIRKSAINGVGQEFANIHEFQEALQRFAMANDFELKFNKNDTNHVVGVCASEGCPWKINATWVPSKKTFKIMTLNNIHTCGNESKNWLVNTINIRLQKSPHLKPNEISNALIKDFSIKLNRTQEQRHGSDTDAYNKLPWFCEKIIETNPGSISNLVIRENKRFKALFVSFYASLCGFLNGCRPLLFLEATSLRSKYGEFVLTANAIDANDGFFPVAFAIIDVEDESNWLRFLEQLKAAILNSKTITFVFNREKNYLKLLVFEVFQDSYVGYSIYHLLERFKKNVKDSFQGYVESFLPDYFLRAAHAVCHVGFKMSTERIKHISLQAYDWVMQFEPQHWATSSFKGERYNYITKDVSLPLAKLMEDYQELPILHKIDAIIRTMINALADTKLDAYVWSSYLTPLKEKELQEENVRSRGLKVLILSDTLFEVCEGLTHVVNISTWSCTCLGWKETGLPCRHALAVFGLIGENPYEFCSNYFTVDAYRLTYVDDIALVPIDKEEGDKMEVEITGGEIDEAFIVEGWSEKIEVEISGGEVKEALNVGGGNDEG